MSDYWDKPKLKREQLVLFSEKLDEVVPPDHDVRLLDAILNQIDWADWEARYHGRIGRPPIHPRIMTGVVLYGLMTRIRSSRNLENALQVRLDFRWLVEGRSIDHTTISEFRRKFGVELKELFVKIGELARTLGFLSLAILAFDGTRIRANNRRKGTRSRAELERARDELAAKYEASERQAASEDVRDEEATTSMTDEDREKERADLERKQAMIKAALAEYDRAEAADEALPKRIPITDPESRKTPNKEGGYAPNYTPLATVDVESGLIVSPDVIPGTNENHFLKSSIDDVRERFGLDEDDSLKVLADGMMSTGENLEEMDEANVVLYSPVSAPDPSTNPAVRDDPTQPIPEDQWDSLPTGKIGGKNEKVKRLKKEAFVYDEENDCYRCPMGRALPFSQRTSETRQGRRRERKRYKSEPKTCASCPLRDRCVKKGCARRELSRDQRESRREAHAKFMATDEAKETYALRSHPGERPFAVIKQVFGARRFLLRGLEKVRVEWTWLSTAFNMTRLIGLLRTRAGPDALKMLTFS